MHLLLSGVIAMGFFIPASREQNLRKYKYSGFDGSLLSKYVLTPYWSWLVELLPRWYAPNLVTLSVRLYSVERES